MSTFYRQPVKLTKRFKDALKELCIAEMEMMQKHQPNYADCWTWGEVSVGDLSSATSLSFRFGSDDDKPSGMREAVRIIES